MSKTRTVSLSDDTIQDGYVPVWNAGTSSFDGLDNTTLGTFTASGDLSGSNASQTVIAIQNVPVNATAPADGYVLTYDLADGYWHAAAAPTGFSAGTDLSGTATNQTVIAIQNVPVNATVPADGYVLTYDLADGYWHAAESPAMSAADRIKFDGIQKQGVSIAIAAMDINWSLGVLYTKTLSAGSNTFTFSNVTDGYSITARVTGAASTLTWPGGIVWVGGYTPIQPPSGTAIYTFIRDASTTYGAMADTASSGGWITALDLDYTAEATQSLATDTTYTIGGVIHTKINSAADATAMAVTNTVGLVQIPVAASAYAAGARTAPGVAIDLATIIPDFYPGMKVRVWARLSYTNMGATAQDIPYLVIEPGSTTLSYIVDNYNDGAKRQQTFISFGGANTSTNDSTNAGDDVLILEAVIGEPIITSHSGAWSAGWPVMNAIHYRSYLRAAGSPATDKYDMSTLGAAVWNVLLAAGRNGSGNALQVTWKNLRIDYKP